MRFWLVTIGEPVPVSPNCGDRLHRTGYLANILSENDHDVIWWTSTFDHFRKKHLFKHDTSVMLNSHLRVNLLHGFGYRNNISMARVLDHRAIARKFATLIKRQEELPDIIIASLPTIELCVESVKYGRDKNVPVVLDMRDMWPDIFVDHAPKILNRIVKLLLTSMFKSSHRACSDASAITGITDDFVNWGLSRGNRTKSDKDKSFPHGYISAPPGDDNIEKAAEFWDKLGIFSGGNEFVVCFIGTIGRQFGLDGLIKAVYKLEQYGKVGRVVICGTGDLLEYYKDMAQSCSKILFPGWVNAAQIHVLLRRSSIGIAPLPNRYDYLATINNKAIEYLSAGLPTISCPDKGVLSDLLNDNQCGMSYPYGDADALAAAIARLYDDRVTLKKMSQNAMRLFQERFTAEKVYTEMMEHMITIVKKRESLRT